MRLNLLDVNQIILEKGELLIPEKLERFSSQLDILPDEVFNLVRKHKFVGFPDKISFHKLYAEKRHHLDYYQFSEKTLNFFDNDLRLGFIYDPKLNYHPDNGIRPMDEMKRKLFLNEIETAHSSIKPLLKSCDFLGLLQRISYSKLLDKYSDELFTHIFETPTIVLKFPKIPLLLFYGSNIVLKNGFYEN